MNRQRGFTLIELIITIAVLSSGIIGVYSAFSPIVVATYNLSSRLTAAYLAQEGMEIVKNIRDTNVAQGGSAVWNQGLANCSLGCQADYTTGTQAQTVASQLKVYDDKNPLVINEYGLYGYGAGVATPFFRKITITQDDGFDIMKVLVEVFWNYNGKPLQVVTSGYLYNYQQ